MITVTTAFNGLAIGDRITGIDGLPVDPPQVVAGAPDGDRVRLDPEASPVERWAYRDQASRFTVERPEPEPTPLIDYDEDGPRVPDYDEDGPRVPDYVVTGLTGRGGCFNGWGMSPDEHRSHDVLHQLVKAWYPNKTPERTYRDPETGYHVTLSPRLRRIEARRAQIGDVVLVPRWGNWQAGVVLSSGPKRVRVAFIARQGAKATHPRVFRPWFPHAAVCVVTGERWAQDVIRGIKTPREK